MGLTKDGTDDARTLESGVLRYCVFIKQQPPNEFWKCGICQITGSVVANKKCWIVKNISAYPISSIQIHTAPTTMRLVVSTHIRSIITLKWECALGCFWIHIDTSTIFVYMQIAECRLHITFAIATYSSHAHITWEHNTRMTPTTCNTHIFSWKFPRTIFTHHVLRRLLYIIYFSLTQNTREKCANVPEPEKWCACRKMKFDMFCGSFGGEPHSQLSVGPVTVCIVIVVAHRRWATKERKREKKLIKTGDAGDATYNTVDGRCRHCQRKFIQIRNMQIEFPVRNKWLFARRLNLLRYSVTQSNSFNLDGVSLLWGVPCSWK